MVKTLGIKFEVAGVSEAIASLAALQKNVSESIGFNQKQINGAIKDAQVENTRVLSRVRNNQLYRYLNREKNKLDRDLKESYRLNFGTKSEKQNTIIRQEKRDFALRDTYKNLTVDNKALVLEFRLAYKEFFIELQSLLEQLKPENGIFSTLKEMVFAPIKFTFDALLFPFQSALAGAFQRIGEVQVQDFAEGFNKNLQRELGLSFEETGGDVGKVIGRSLYKVYEKSIASVDDYVKGKFQFNLADTFIEAMEYTTKTLAKELPALALRTHRRIQINKKAIPEARRAAGLAKIENQLPQETIRDIQSNRSITLVYGGANTDDADIGKDYTARVMKPYLKGSAVIPLTREWTNKALDSEFQGDVKNLIKLIMRNETAKNTFKGFVSSNGLSSLGATEQKELLAGLDIEGELDLSSVDRLAEIVQSLLENKDFSLGKALSATFKGYNPDDVLGAAQAISIMEQFPEKELQIAGFSQGGYNALGTVDLLNRMGYDKVKGFSIGTPITGANATVNPDNFRAFMGDQDYYYKALTGLASDQIDFPEFFELGKKEGALHSLQGYVRGDDLRGGLQAFLADRVSLPKAEKYGKHDSAYSYSVGELGAETGIIRTLLTYLGESELGQVKAKDGFVFSSEESLPGYTNNLKKLGKGLKDEDTKKFHSEYIDFLETLQQELEIAEKLAAIGKRYKPVKSLKKAARIFPQIEPLTVKHNTSGLSKEEFIAAQAEANEKASLIAFKLKIKQQKDNIERTFQAMLGRNFSKKDESKGIYSFYNPQEYEERAFNFEGMVNWLKNDVLAGTTEQDRAEVQPTVALLENIVKSIRETGTTGSFDISTARSASDLIGIDLREFELLFKEFEKSGKTKIDVNKYKDELRSFRRNRDQILNEKAVPKNVAETLQQAKKKINNVSQPPHQGTSSDPLNQNDRPIEPTQISQQIKEDYSETQKAYFKRLETILEQANILANSAIKNQTVDFDFESAYQYIQNKIKEYRKAVENSNFELAHSVGEELLSEAEFTRIVFSEAGDSRKSQLSRIKTEILKGDRGSGRVGIGLAEIPNIPIYQPPGLDLNLNNKATESQEPPKTLEEINLEPKEIIKLYGEYLQTIVNNANAKAAQKIDKLSKSPLDPHRNIESLFETLKPTTEIFEQIEEYKKAVTENRILAAKYFGEKLLEDLQIQKNLIQQTSRDIVNNIDFPENSRNEVLKKGSEEILNLSNSQREIVNGTGAFRDNRPGLMKLAESEEFQKLIVSAHSMGAEAKDGFDLGLNDNAETIAISFVNTIVKRILDDLEIQSPSRVFTWIGEMIKLGFEAGVKGIDTVLITPIENAAAQSQSTISQVIESINGVAQELDGGQGLLDTAFATEGIDASLDGFFATAIENVRSLFDTLVEKYPIIGQVTSAIASVGGEILEVLGVFSFAQAFVQFAQDALAATSQMELLDTSITSVSNSSSEAAENIAFVRGQAKNLSVDLVTAADSYKRLLGASRNTSLEGLQTERLFSTLATTAKVRGLSPDATSRLYLGFEQVIAKD